MEDVMRLNLIIFKLKFSTANGSNL